MILGDEYLRVMESVFFRETAALSDGDGRIVARVSAKTKTVGARKEKLSPRHSHDDSVPSDPDGTIPVDANGHVIPGPGRRDVNRRAR